MTIVRDCMFRNIATLSGATTLQEAARRVLQEGLGFAVALDNMVPSGMVTEFDLIKWMVRGHRMETTLIQDLPIPTPHVVTEETDCQEFLNIYNKRRFRRFPVLNEDGLLSGGVMERQILSSLPRSNLLSSYRVANMVVTGPPSVAPGTSFMECAKRIVQWHRGSLLVLLDGALLGLVTEGDLLRARASESWQPDMTVESFMTQKVTTIAPDKDLLEAMALFRRHGHRQLPVMDDDGLIVGLLTQTDILKQFARAGRSRQAVLNPEDVQEPALWFHPSEKQPILALNQKAEAYLEMASDLWVGRSVQELSEDPEVWHAIYVLLKSSGQLQRIRLPIRNGAGQMVKVQCRFNLVRTPSGEDRVCWVIHDLENVVPQCAVPGM